MPDITSYSNGRPSWADLMCHDGDAAKHFYSSLFDGMGNRGQSD